MYVEKWNIDHCYPAIQNASYHPLDCSVGGSFCAMWYSALMAFMLNRGGFLSAEEAEKNPVKTHLHSMFIYKSNKKNNKN